MRREGDLIGQQARIAKTHGGGDAGEDAPAVGIRSVVQHCVEVVRHPVHPRAQSLRPCRAPAATTDGSTMIYHFTGDVSLYCVNSNIYGLTIF